MHRDRTVSIPAHNQCICSPYVNANEAPVLELIQWKKEGCFLTDGSHVPAVMWAGPVALIAH